MSDSPEPPILPLKLEHLGDVSLELLLTTVHLQRSHCILELILQVIFMTDKLSCHTLISKALIIF